MDSKFGPDKVTNMCSLVGSYEVSNDVNIDGSLVVISLGSEDLLHWNIQVDPKMDSKLVID